MKIKALFLTAILGLMTLTTTVAQTPMSFTYQAVVRNSSGQLVSNATVGVRISIIQGSLNGRAVYNSTQTATTNANGLLTIIIGNGQNPIDTINWANSPYYLKSEVDPAGGSNYTLSTVQQMLSVPYALHAHTVDNANFVEQQVLTMSGDTIFLTGGSFVVLPANSTIMQKLSDVTAINDSANSQIKNLYNPTDSMDAVNLRTLNSYITAITHRHDSIIGHLTRIIDTLRNPTSAVFLPDTFSIGVTRQVRFSKGNLQYTTTGTHAVAGGGTAPGTWRFAEHQYDVIGNNNSNISSSYSGWIDLFGKGTSGWNSGVNAYQPYSTSQRSSDYYGYSSTGAYANADWGVYNAISNGGNQPGLWRTLTNAEWDTLLHIRSTSSGIRYAKATVNGMAGLIIVPDNWRTSTYALDSTNAYRAPFTSNIITSVQWAILEGAGCVFLPAAGTRVGSTVDTNSVSQTGDYWTATALCDFLFSNAGGVVTYNEHRTHKGLSVRLVQDVQP